MHMARRILKYHRIRLRACLSTDPGHYRVHRHNTKYILHFHLIPKNILNFFKNKAGTAPSDDAIWDETSTKKNILFITKSANKVQI